MDIAEFVDLGYLQEANRQFFHPLGLALAVEVDEDGTGYITGVWDEREDLEGIWFDPPPEAAKEAFVRGERHRRDGHRVRALGSVIQPSAGQGR